MPKITAIKQQKRKGRFNVYVDEKFAIGLSAEALIKAELKIGQEISEKEIKKLAKKDIEGKLYNKALRFLSYRPRSEKEVRDCLVKKIRAHPFKVRVNQGGMKTVERIMSKLKSLKLIDDQEFCRWWIEQRQTFRPKGIYALKGELRQKGVSEKTMAKWLNLPAGKAGGSMVKELELEGARKAIQKKLRFLRNLNPKEVRVKLTGFLQRRGFSYDTIKLVLDELLSKK